MKYVSHRDITVASVYGVSREFKKGKPLDCPPLMHGELLAAGVLPVDEIVEPTVIEGTTEPVAPEARLKELFVAYEKMALRSKRGDFSGSGVPNLAVLTELLGWKVEAKERDSSWAKFQVKSPE